MTIKLMVLYPCPRDEAVFEREYLTKHLPLMRELIDQDATLSTYRVVGTPERPPPFYRVAEIRFPDQQCFDAFTQSGKSKLGRSSSIEVSTGGKPTFLVCEEHPQP